MTKELWTVLTVVFLGFLGISIPYLLFPALFLLPEYAIVPESWSEGVRGLFLGITLAAYPFGQFFGSPILGSLSDDYGRKSILSISLVIAAFFSLLSALAIIYHSIWLLIVGRFLMGFMEGNIAIARAMAADMKELSKHRTFGLINAAASIAYMLGPFIGALLIDSFPSTPFLLIAFLFFALGALSFYNLPRSQITEATQRKSVLERMHLPRRLGQLCQDATLRFLLVVATLHTLVADLFYQFGPIYLTEQWVLSPSSLAWYNGALCLALAVGNGWAASFVARYWSNRHATVLGMIALLTALVAMLFAPNSLVMLCCFALAGFGIAIAITNLTIGISDRASENIQGEVMGVQQSLRVFGDGTICLLGGLILFASTSVMLILAAILSFFVLAYYIRNSKEKVGLARLYKKQF